MTLPILLAADLVAVCVLVLALYLPRHRRKDMVVAYLGVNIGVFAVAAVLAGASTMAAGLGLGLFGVLSIIRLRSEELSQREVAYYFAALTIGLITGLGGTLGQGLAPLGLVGAVLAVIAIADSPRLFSSGHRTMLVLDRALTDDAALRAHLETTLSAEILHVSVLRIDLVNDSTQVHVSYRPWEPAPLAGGRRAVRRAAVSAR